MTRLIEIASQDKITPMAIKYILKELTGKTLKIQYDGKKFKGRMNDFYYDEPNNTGFIIEGNNNEWKYIKSNYID